MKVTNQSYKSLSGPWDKCGRRQADMVESGARGAMSGHHRGRGVRASTPIHSGLVEGDVDVQLLVRICH